MAGVIWAVASAISFSLSSVAIAKGLPPLGVVRATTVILASGALMVAAVTLPLEGTAVLAAAPPAAILFFVAAGVIHYGGWGFMNASIRRIGPSRMSAVAGTTPMFAALFAVAFLGEQVNLLVGVGMGMIVAGTYFIAVS